MKSTMQEPTFEERLDRMQDELFSGMKRFEQPVVRMTARFAPRFAEFVPERPAMMAPMPKFGWMVDRGLAFRKRMVDEQAKFVRSMMKALDPVMVKVDHIAETEPVKAPTPIRHAARPAPRRARPAA
jgi:hypothetical protein